MLCAMLFLPALFNFCYDLTPFFRSIIAVPNARLCVLCLRVPSEDQGVLGRVMVREAAGAWTEEHLSWLNCHVAESSATSQLQCPQWFLFFQNQLPLGTKQFQIYISQNQ